MFIRHFQNMLADESGAILVEYSLTFALLSIASVFAFVAIEQAAYKTMVSASASASAPAMYFYSPLQ